MLMVTQLHRKLKLNHAVNQKSVNLVHGVNGPNVTLNAINLDKCFAIANVTVLLVFPKKMKNVVVIPLNAKPARVHHAHV